jgi:hypothetical protein
MGKEGIQRIALGPSMPYEGSRNSYSNGGACANIPFRTF